MLVLYADVPLLRAESLRAMQAEKQRSGADLVILTAEAPSIPGRILRDAVGRVERVVEQQDATDEELAIRERNTGVYLLDAQLLRSGLARLDAANAQGELYLTDVVESSVRSGKRVAAIPLADADECLGINTREELAAAVARAAPAHRLALDGRRRHPGGSRVHLHRRGRPHRAGYRDRAGMPDPRRHGHRRRLSHQGVHAPSSRADWTTRW